MRGVTVGLHVRTQTGTDALNNPVYSDKVVSVDNVLVGEPSADEIAGTISLYNKQMQYVLGIPKGDTHNWKDTEVDIFGRTFRTFGDVIEGIEANVPTPWHKKVRVERCE